MDWRPSAKAPLPLVVVAFAILALLVAGFIWFTRLGDIGDGGGQGAAVIETADGTVATAPLPIAETPGERQLGLSGRQSLAPDSGMIFRFDAPTTSSFWMKDTLVPLSIAFIDEQHNIVAILDMDPCTADPCPTYAPDTEYVAAIEMNQGWFKEHGVRAGDTVTWNQAPPTV